MRLAGNLERHRCLCLVIGGSRCAQVDRVVRGSGVRRLAHRDRVGLVDGIDGFDFLCELLVLQVVQRRHGSGRTRGVKIVQVVAAEN